MPGFDKYITFYNINEEVSKYGYLNILKKLNEFYGSALQDKIEESFKNKPLRTALLINELIDYVSMTDLKKKPAKDKAVSSAPEPAGGRVSSMVKDLDSRSATPMGVGAGSDPLYDAVTRPMPGRSGRAPAVPARPGIKLEAPEVEPAVVESALSRSDNPLLLIKLKEIIYDKVKRDYENAYEYSQVIKDVKKEFKGIFNEVLAGFLINKMKKLKIDDALKEGELNKWAVNEYSKLLSYWNGGAGPDSYCIDDYLYDFLGTDNKFLSKEIINYCGNKVTELNNELQKVNKEFNEAKNPKVRMDLGDEIDSIRQVINSYQRIMNSKTITPNLLLEADIEKSKWLVKSSFSGDVEDSINKLVNNRYNKSGGLTESRYIAREAADIHLRTAKKHEEDRINIMELLNELSNAKDSFTFKDTLNRFTDSRGCLEEFLQDSSLKINEYEAIKALEKNYDYDEVNKLNKDKVKLKASDQIINALKNDPGAKMGKTVLTLKYDGVSVLYAMIKGLNQPEVELKFDDILNLPSPEKTSTELTNSMRPLVERGIELLKDELEPLELVRDLNKEEVIKTEFNKACYRLVNGKEPDDKSLIEDNYSKIKEDYLKQSDMGSVFKLLGLPADPYVIISELILDDGILKNKGFDKHKVLNHLKHLTSNPDEAYKKTQRIIDLMKKVKEQKVDNDDSQETLNSIMKIKKKVNELINETESSSEKLFINKVKSIITGDDLSSEYLITESLEKLGYTDSIINKMGYEVKPGTAYNLKRLSIEYTRVDDAYADDILNKLSQSFELRMLRPQDGEDIDSLKEKAKEMLEQARQFITTRNEDKNDAVNNKINSIKTNLALFIKENKIQFKLSDLVKARDDYVTNSPKRGYLSRFTDSLNELIKEDLNDASRKPYVKSVFNELKSRFNRDSNDNIIDELTDEYSGLSEFKKKVIEFIQSDDNTDIEERIPVNERVINNLNELRNCKITALRLDTPRRKELIKHLVNDSKFNNIMKSCTYYYEAKERIDEFISKLMTIDNESLNPELRNELESFRRQKDNSEDVKNKFKELFDKIEAVKKSYDPGMPLPEEAVYDELINAVKTAVSKVEVYKKDLKDMLGAYAQDADGWLNDYLNSCIKVVEDWGNNPDNKVFGNLGKAYTMINYNEMHLEDLLNLHKRFELEKIDKLIDIEKIDLVNKLQKKLIDSLTNNWRADQLKKKFNSWGSELGDEYKNLNLADDEENLINHLSDRLMKSWNPSYHDNKELTKNLNNLLSINEKLKNSISKIKDPLTMKALNQWISYIEEPGEFTDFIMRKHNCSESEAKARFVDEVTKLKERLNNIKSKLSDDEQRFITEIISDLTSYQLDFNDSESASSIKGIIEGVNKIKSGVSVIKEAEDYLDFTASKKIKATVYYNLLKGVTDTITYFYDSVRGMARELVHSGAVLNDEEQINNSLAGMLGGVELDDITLRTLEKHGIKPVKENSIIYKRILKDNQFITELISDVRRNPESDKINAEQWNKINQKVKKERLYDRFILCDYLGSSETPEQFTEAMISFKDDINRMFRQDEIKKLQVLGEKFDNGDKNKLIKELTDDDRDLEEQYRIFIDKLNESLKINDAPALKNASYDSIKKDVKGSLDDKLIDDELLDYMIKKKAGYLKNELFNSIISAPHDILTGVKSYMTELTKTDTELSNYNVLTKVRDNLNSLISNLSNSKNGFKNEVNKLNEKKMYFQKVYDSVIQSEEKLSRIVEKLVTKADKANLMGFQYHHELMSDDIMVRLMGSLKKGMKKHIMGLLGVNDDNTLANDSLFKMSDQTSYKLLVEQKVNSLASELKLKNQDSLKKFQDILISYFDKSAENRVSFTMQTPISVQLNGKQENKVLVDALIDELFKANHEQINFRNVKCNDDLTNATDSLLKDYFNDNLKDSIIKSVGESEFGNKKVFGQAFEIIDSIRTCKTLNDIMGNESGLSIPSDAIKRLGSLDRVKAINAIEHFLSDRNYSNILKFNPKMSEFFKDVIKGKVSEYEHALKQLRDEASNRLKVEIDNEFNDLENHVQHIKNVIDNSNIVNINDVLGIAGSLERGIELNSQSLVNEIQNLNQVIDNLGKVAWDKHHAQEAVSRLENQSSTIDNKVKLLNMLERGAQEE